MEDNNEEFAFTNDVEEFIINQMTAPIVDGLEHLPAEVKAMIINKLIQDLKVDTNLISDGFHTFGELYEHRIQNYIALAKAMDEASEGMVVVWKSKYHSDGSCWEGWFILGIHLEEGHQITYHLPISKWDECNFALEMERGVYDGHNSNDVLKRLRDL